MSSSLEIVELTADTLKLHDGSATSDSDLVRHPLMFIFSALFLLLRCLILPRIALAAEILALRQQLTVLNRSVKRPKLRQTDRLSWVILSALWNGWREALVIVKPDTVVKWPEAGISALLALEIKSAPCWTSANRSRDS